MAPPTRSGHPVGDDSGLNDIKYGFVAPGDLTQVAALESWPIDSLWVGGHVASPNPSPEALVGLARLSAVTERVSIGTSILLLPLYPPAIVAKQIADLDQGLGWTGHPRDRGRWRVSAGVQGMRRAPRRKRAPIGRGDSLTQEPLERRSGLARRPLFLDGRCEDPPAARSAGWSADRGRRSKGSRHAPGRIARGWMDALSVLATPICLVRLSYPAVG